MSDELWNKTSNDDWHATDLEGKLDILRHDIALIGRAIRDDRRYIGEELVSIKAEIEKLKAQIKAPKP